MPNPYFKFKQFTVFHDKCAMKVGVDGVTLGAWANVDNAKNILDIGTGSGLIALMLAQRSNAIIDAIDIEENAVLQAQENVDNSSWKERIHVKNCSIQDFTRTTDNKYDLIVSNPPYFLESLKTPSEKRNLARHADELTHEDLLDCSIKLLNPSGIVSFILPVIEAEKLIDYATEILILNCLRKTYLIPKQGKQAKRLLLEFGFTNETTVTSDLIIETHNRQEYTPDYHLLVKDFYLKL